MRYATGSGDGAVRPAAIISPVVGITSRRPASMPPAGRAASVLSIRGGRCDRTEQQRCTYHGDHRFHGLRSMVAGLVGMASAVGGAKGMSFALLASAAAKVPGGTAIFNFQSVKTVS